LIVLLFVALMAVLFHDKLLNLVRGKLSTVIPGGVPGGGAR